MADSSATSNNSTLLQGGRTRLFEALQRMLHSEFMSDRIFALVQLIELGGPVADAAQVLVVYVCKIQYNCA